MELKVCVKCLRAQIKSAFYRKRTGFEAICKICKRNARKEQYRLLAAVEPATLSLIDSRPVISNVSSENLSFIFDIFSTFRQWRDDLNLKPSLQMDNSQTSQKNDSVEPHGE